MTVLSEKFNCVESLTRFLCSSTSWFSVSC